MSCDVGEVTEKLENELCYDYMSSAHSPTFPSQLILQPFRRFTYFTAHSATLPLLHLRHSSFCNPSVASPTSQFILQPFFRFSYFTSSSFNSPGEPSMVLSLNNTVIHQNYHDIITITKLPTFTLNSLHYKKLYSLTEIMKY